MPRLTGRTPRGGLELVGRRPRLQAPRMPWSAGKAIGSASNGRRAIARPREPVPTAREPQPYQVRRSRGHSRRRKYRRAISARRSSAVRMTRRRCARVRGKQGTGQRAVASEDSQPGRQQQGHVRYRRCSNRGVDSVPLRSHVLTGHSHRSSAADAASRSQYRVLGSALVCHAASHSTVAMADAYQGSSRRVCSLGRRSCSTYRHPLGVG